LWRAGVKFSQALANPLMRWSMEKSALAARRTHHLPVQPPLF
jgi:hypothetical protein